MARPRKQPQEARRAVYALRLTAQERHALDAAAAAQGQSPAAYLRARLGPAVSRPVVPALDPALLVALSRIGSNLNQIARRLNAGDGLQPGELPEALQDLAGVLDRIEVLVLAGIET